MTYRTILVPRQLLLHLHERRGNFCHFTKTLDIFPLRCNLFFRGEIFPLKYPTIIKIYSQRISFILLNIRIDEHPLSFHALIVIRHGLVLNTSHFLPVLPFTSLIKQGVQRIFYLPECFIVQNFLESPINLIQRGTFYLPAHLFFGHILQCQFYIITIQKNISTMPRGIPDKIQLRGYLFLQVKNELTIFQYSRIYRLMNPSIFTDHLTQI